jgi:hypothetical protein
MSFLAAFRADPDFQDFSDDEIARAVWETDPELQKQVPLTDFVQQTLVADRERLFDAGLEERDSGWGFGVDQAQKMFYEAVETVGKFEPVQNLLGSEQLIEIGKRGVAQQDKDILQGGYRPTYEGSFLDQPGIGAKLGWVGEKVAENAFMMSIICSGDMLLFSWNMRDCHWPVNESKNRKRISSTTPAATLDRVPCSARPTASEAAPRTAMIEVVCTPSRCSTAIRPTT